MRRLSYANVVATLALFVALGGSSYAAVKLGRGEVKRSHIAKNAVDTTKVAARSLRASDLRPGPSVVGPAGAAGAVGAAGSRGAAGAPGPAGPQGPQGLAAGGLERVVSATLAEPLVARRTESTSPVEDDRHVALAGGAWTQPVGSLALIGGWIEAELPAACSKPLGSGGAVFRLVTRTPGTGAGRRELAWAFLPWTPAKAGTRVRVGLTGETLFSSSEPAARDLTVQFADVCGDAPAERFMLTRVLTSVDLAG